MHDECVRACSCVNSLTTTIVHLVGFSLENLVGTCIWFCVIFYTNKVHTIPWAEQLVTHPSPGTEVGVLLYSIPTRRNVAIWVRVTLHLGRGKVVPVRMWMSVTEPVFKFSDELSCRMNCCVARWNAASTLPLKLLLCEKMINDFNYVRHTYLKSLKSQCLQLPD